MWPVLVALSLIIGFFSYFGLASGWTWEFFGSEGLAVVYDQVGEALKSAQVGIPVNYESYYINGKFVAYWGPFPAFLRVIQNALVPNAFGLWGRISCLIAAGLSIFASSLILRYSLAKNTVLNSFQRSLFHLIFLNAFLFATPIYFLMSRANIYHEAILWGLAGSLLGIYFALRWLWDEEKSFFVGLGLSISAFMAYLSRVTFGFPLLFMIAYFVLLSLHKEYRAVSGSIWWHRLSQVLWTKKTGFMMLALLPAASAVVFMAWYNWARFGSMFTYVDNSGYVLFLKSPELQRILHIGMVDIARIPSALYNYLGFKSSYFSTEFPFVHRAESVYWKPEIFRSVSEPTVSLSVVSTWLCLGALSGLWHLLMRRDGLERITALCFIPQLFIVLTFMMISHRYVTDLLPVLIFLFSVALKNLSLPKHPKMLSFSFFILVSLGIYTTVWTTLRWYS